MRGETQYARSGDTSIAYQVIGQGPLDLVLVSSWITNVEENWGDPSYARLLSRLGAFARLIVFDKRGTGLSDRVVALPNLDDRMDDVRAVMDAAGSAQAALFGSTEGGAMCALFAATFPERTSALVMYGAYAKRMQAPDYPWGLTLEEREHFYDLLIRQWGGPAVLEYLAPSKIDDERFCQWWASYLRHSASPSAALALTKMNTPIDIRHILGAIRVPTLVLHRTDDPLCSMEGARVMATQIPGARFVELPGRDHLPFVGDVDAIVDAVEEFLTGARQPIMRDRVLVTLLVAEIVGATEAAARLEQHAWNALMESYQQLVHGALDRFRGSPIRNTGVGLLATFDGPARAIQCALVIRDAAKGIGIEVRGGLHAGEVDVLPDGVGGSAVEIAARVMARAGPDDTLVTSTVKDLVAGTEIGFDEVDVQLLLGSGQKWRLFRVHRDDGAPRPRPTGDGTASGRAFNGAGRLSRREREVASLVAEGRSNRDIADELSISVSTAERHVANIMNKLGYRSRAQVAAWTVEQELLGEGGS